MGIREEIFTQSEINEAVAQSLRRLPEFEERIADLENGMAALALGTLRLVADTLGLSDNDLTAFLRARAQEVAEQGHAAHSAFDDGDSPLAVRLREAALTLTAAPPRR